jgi:hypothetical protein
VNCIRRLILNGDVGGIARRQRVVVFGGSDRLLGRPVNNGGIGDCDNGQCVSPRRFSSRQIALHAGVGRTSLTVGLLQREGLIDGREMLVRHSIQKANVRGRNPNQLLYNEVRMCIQRSIQEVRERQLRLPWRENHWRAT